MDKHVLRSVGTFHVSCDSKVFAGVSIWRYGAKNSATEKSAAPSHPNPAPNIFVLPKKEKEKKKATLPGFEPGIP